MVFEPVLKYRIRRYPGEYNTYSSRHRLPFDRLEFVVPSARTRV